MEKGTEGMAAAAPAPPAAASQCRSPRCTAERRGVRRELDSWRHRLMHCVGKRGGGGVTRLQRGGPRGKGRGGERALRGERAVGWARLSEPRSVGWAEGGSEDGGAPPAAFLEGGSGDGVCRGERRS